MMSSHPMKDALKRRMSRGLDITITVGDPQDGKKPESDLAPPGDHMDAEQDQQMMPQGGPMHPDPVQNSNDEEMQAGDEGLDEAMLGGMSPQDHAMLAEKSQGMGSKMSLGERARMEAMKRRGK